MQFLGETVKDNDLIMLAGKASVLLPLPLVCAAVLSQFSAAVADTMGGSGNMVEATHDHVDSRHANLIICSGAVMLASFPTLTILAFASRAFAFYYMLQCLIAITVAKSVFQESFFAVTCPPEPTPGGMLQFPASISNWLLVTTPEQDWSQSLLTS